MPIDEPLTVAISFGHQLFQPLESCISPVNNAKLFPLFYFCENLLGVNRHDYDSTNNEYNIEIVGDAYRVSHGQHISCY